MFGYSLKKKKKNFAKIVILMVILVCVFFLIYLIATVMLNTCCSHQQESELETQDTSDQDGNDELKDFKESAEDENLNSKELPSAEKKRYLNVEPAETTEDVEKDSENQVRCILSALLSATCIHGKSELVLPLLLAFLSLKDRLEIFFFSSWFVPE